MDGRRREGGLIYELMSALTDGQLAGELLHCTGDDGCFESGSPCERESKSMCVQFIYDIEYIQYTASVIVCVCVHTPVGNIIQLPVSIETIMFYLFCINTMLQ